MQGHFCFIKSPIFAFLPDIDVSAICYPEKHLKFPFMRGPLKVLFYIFFAALRNKKITLNSIGFFARARHIFRSGFKKN